MIRLTVGELAVNCYIIWDSVTKEAFVIDPGGDAADILDAVRREGLKVRYIVNTHGHFDHVGADGEVKAATGAPLAVHRKDSVLLSEAHEHGVIFGVRTNAQPAPDVYLEEGGVITAGKVTLRIIHTPGHTPGGVCLYEKEMGLLFTGDTLFAGSIGRTDFPGGSYEDLIGAVKKKLLHLGDSVRVLPGHGPESTIGEEKETNPFLVNG